MDKAQLEKLETQAESLMDRSLTWQVNLPAPWTTVVVLAQWGAFLALGIVLGVKLS